MAPYFLVFSFIAFGVGFFFTSGFATIITYAISGLWLVCGVFSLPKYIAEKKSPVLSTQAKVFSKTTKTSGGSTSYIGDGQFTHDSVTTKHFISFEFNGRRENVEVHVSLYNTLAKNDVGLLEYKDVPGSGFQFISFQRQA